MRSSTFIVLSAVLAGWATIAVADDVPQWVAAAVPGDDDPCETDYQNYKVGTTPDKTTEGADRAKPSAQPTWKTMETRSAPREWLGWGKRKTDPFEGFQRPVTNLNFHHPFMWNEIRPLFVYHKFPERSAVDGGNLQIYALQVFVNITDDLQFMAYKDGYVDFNPDALPDETGYADIAFGLKYKLAENVDTPSILSVGLGYETKTGSRDVLEGSGSGIFDAFASGAFEVGEANAILTAGLLIPTSSTENTHVFHAHAHVDFEVYEGVHPLVELNWHHYYDDGHRDGGLGAPLNVEGFDYTNLGSSSVDNQDVVTLGVGVRYEVDDDVTVGAAYEVPVTNRKDLFDRRFTFDVTFRF